MSIFGSRDDDPLLQDDPFAPSGEDDEGSRGGAPAEKRSSEEERSEGASNRLGSLFESGEGEEERGQDQKRELEQETLQVRCSTDESRQAPLDRLNALFEQGWRVDHIEHKPSERTPATEETSARHTTLLFILRRGQR
jgi:hypothetical protein